MEFMPFAHKFPELRTAETRWVMLCNDPVVPDDQYAFLDMYCTEPGCDCRRTLVHVLARKDARSPIATINFGWDCDAAYKRFTRLGFTAVEIKGPNLAIGFPQGPYAKDLLRVFENLIQDSDYVERIRRHYAMFKAAVDGRKPAPEDRGPGGGTWAKRNAPCPCGSGRKYKNCCG